MMDANTLVETYVAHLGLKRIKGTGADPILPFFILDVMNTILHRDIFPVKSQFEEKKARKLWVQNYHIFNKDFFSAFNDDQQDEIIDIMDGFETFINNDVVIVKVAVMNEISKYGVELEDQVVLADVLVCHILAQSAQILWTAVYRKENPYIRSILFYAGKWMELYAKRRVDRAIHTEDSEEITNAVNALCKKIVKFLDRLKI